MQGVRGLVSLHPARFFIGDLEVEKEVFMVYSPPTVLLEIGSETVEYLLFYLTAGRKVRAFLHVFEGLLFVL